MLIIVDANSSDLRSYSSNTKPNGSLMVGLCFDDDKQGNSDGKRKSIHEKACKQTSKIPSNTTYLELEDDKEKKDGNTLVSTDALKDKQDVRRLFNLLRNIKYELYIIDSYHWSNTIKLLFYLFIGYIISFE